MRCETTSPPDRGRMLYPGHCPGNCPGHCMTLRMAAPKPPRACELIMAARSGAAIRRGLMPKSENAAECAAEPAVDRPPRRAFAGNQRIGVAVPLAPGVIVSENRGIRPCLVSQAERQIDFDKPFERLGDM